MCDEVELVGDDLVLALGVLFSKVAAAALLRHCAASSAVNGLVSAESVYTIFCLPHTTCDRCREFPRQSPPTAATRCEIQVIP